jgi:hypothetical protein
VAFPALSSSLQPGPDPSLLLQSQCSIFCSLINCHV